MSKTIYFTSIIPNYLAKARVLCRSLKEFNPDAFFVLGICDSNEIDKDLLKDPFDATLEFDSLDIIKDKKSFLFKHTVIELCTAVKPFYAETIINKYHAEKVIYLDPDIGVFDSLEPLSSLLDQYSIILTPHQLGQEIDDVYVRENEILFLKRGTFNLGFFGVKSDYQGLEFLHWWQNRLYNYCFDDDYEVLPELAASNLLGLFTDQKWIDLVPCFFSNHYIIRDPGYNVCTWNLSNRHVQRSTDGYYRVNGFPLRFFHFSGYDSGGHHNELLKSIQHYPNNKDVLQLGKWYDKHLQQEGQEKIGEIKYSLTKYENGENIQDFERKIYHIRKDMYNIFKDPFLVSKSEPCFYYWVRTEYNEYFDKTKYIDRRQEEISASAALNRWLPRGSLRRRVILFLARKLFPK